MDMLGVKRAYGALIDKQRLCCESVLASPALNSLRLSGSGNFLPNNIQAPSLPPTPTLEMSDSSSLSSPPMSDDEAQVIMKADAAKKRASVDTSDDVPKTPKRKRPASPPHEEVLADNPDIPVSQEPIYHVVA